MEEGCQVGRRRRRTMPKLMDAGIFRSVLSFLFFSAGLLPSQTWGIGDTHLCASPLGMESGEIPNSALSASSYYVKNVGPDTARLNLDMQGGAWCPREPISVGVREWLQVSLNSTHLLSGIQMQGRFSNGLGQEYAEEFQLEYWREGFTNWRKYYRFDGKSVFPGNTDTSSVVTTKLRPPLFAERVRFVPYSAHRRTVCMRVELLGCPWRGGVVQYSMLQGDAFSEGISLKDDTYDGEGSKWDRRVDVTVAVPLEEGNIGRNQESGQEGDGEDQDNSGDAEMVVPVTPPMLTTTEESNLPRESLSVGLGQLTDQIEGANSFTMDIGYGQGNGWVGWRRRPEERDWIEVIFEFDTVRQFSRVDILVNNYPSKGVQFFSRCVVQFSLGGMRWNGQPAVHYIPPMMGIDLSQEHTRNLTIPLEDRFAKFLKLQLFYRSQWILLGEVYFHSDLFEGNWTIEEEDGPDLDFPMDTQAPLEIGDLDGSMVETVVGVVTGLILLSGVVAGAVIYLRKNGRSISSAFQFTSGSGDRTSGTTFHFPWRHSWNSVPTHIVTQTNPASDGVKDLLLTLAPASNGDVHLSSNPHHPSLYIEGPNNANPGRGVMLNGGVIINGGVQDFPKVHNNLRDHQSVSPPPYTANGPVTSSSAVGATGMGKNNQMNGLKYPGSHYNNYGTTSKGKPFADLVPSVAGKGVDSTSSTSGCYSSNNASSASSNVNGGDTSMHPPSHSRNVASPTKMTLRSNQLANEDDWRGVPLEEGGSLPAGEMGFNNGTLRNSTNRHRKAKVATSTWNLVFEGNGRPARNQRGHAVPDISLRQLRLIENLGSCVYGQVHLYDFEGEVECSEGTVYRNCRLIAKTIKSMSEVRLLGVLDHEHVLEMICLCTELKKPILALYPAPECGDLCSFLSRLTNTPSLSWLLSVASQIASGMNYLESLCLVHRDLAARNCLVEREGSIRISDLAMSCEQYRDDYCHTPDGLRPLRWWSWESILSGDFTLQSSVWSFGVTLWEILTLCRQKPLHHIADHQVTTLAEKYGDIGHYSQSSEPPPMWLAKPVLSPPEIFDLMRECWKRDPSERPSFQNIHLFLEQKCNTHGGSASTGGPIYHSIT